MFKDIICLEHIKFVIDVVNSMDLSAKFATKS